MRESDWSSDVCSSDLFPSHDMDADVVFVYLVPKTLNRLIPKFKKELKKGTKIVSFKYEMDLKMIDEDRDSELRLYVI